MVHGARRHRTLQDSASRVRRGGRGGSRGCVGGGRRTRRRGRGGVRRRVFSIRDASGYDLMIDFLSDGPTLRGLLAVLSIGADRLAAERGAAHGEALAASAVLAALECLVTALEGRPERGGGATSRGRRGIRGGFLARVPTHARRRPAPRRRAVRRRVGIRPVSIQPRASPRPLREAERLHRTSGRSTGGLAPRRSRVDRSSKARRRAWNSPRFRAARARRGAARRRRRRRERWRRLARWSSTSSSTRSRVPRLRRAPPSRIRRDARLGIVQAGSLLGVQLRVRAPRAPRGGAALVRGGRRGERRRARRRVGGGGEAPRRRRVSSLSSSPTRAPPPRRRRCFARGPPARLRGNSDSRCSPRTRWPRLLPGIRRAAPPPRITARGFYARRRRRWTPPRRRRDPSRRRPWTIYRPSSPPPSARRCSGTAPKGRRSGRSARRPRWNRPSTRRARTPRDASPTPPPPLAAAAGAAAEATRETATLRAELGVDRLLADRRPAEAGGCAEITPAATPSSPSRARRSTPRGIEARVGRRRRDGRRSRRRRVSRRAQGGGADRRAPGARVQRVRGGTRGARAPRERVVRFRRGGGVAVSPRRRRRRFRVPRG